MASDSGRAYIFRRLQIAGTWCRACRKRTSSIFESFVNDEESIRIGIISHLADFMRHVGESWRESYLPIMTQILGNVQNEMAPSGIHRG